MATLLFVRHGHTEANGAGTGIPMSGSTDLPLSARGRHQAERVASRLATVEVVKTVYSSPLARAFETAKAIGERLDAGVLALGELREIDCGFADGLALEDVKERFPDAWERNLRQDDPAFRWPGGESYVELRERSLRAVRTIAGRHPSARVVIVTHAGVVAQVLGFVRGVSAARWECFRPSNGSVTEVVWRDEASSIVRFDDRTHLDDRG